MGGGWKLGGGGWGWGVGVEMGGGGVGGGGWGGGGGGGGGLTKFYIFLGTAPWQGGIQILYFPVP